MLQQCGRQLPPAGRRGGMYLCAEHFLLPAVPLVPGGCPPAGRCSVRRDHKGPRPFEAVLRMRGQLHAEVQSGEILSRLCQENAPPKGGRAAEEKIPSHIKSKKLPVKGAFWDYFLIDFTSSVVAQKFVLIVSISSLLQIIPHYREKSNSFSS